MPFFGTTLLWFVSTDIGVGLVGTPPKPPPGPSKLVTCTETASESPVLKSPRPGELKHEASLVKKAMSLFCLHVVSYSSGPYEVRGMAKLCSPVKQVEERTSPMDKTRRKAEESAVDVSPVAVSSPVLPPISRSPVKGEQRGLPSLRNLLFFF